MCEGRTLQELHKILRGIGFSVTLANLQAMELEHAAWRGEAQKAFAQYEEDFKNRHFTPFLWRWLIAKPVLMLPPFFGVQNPMLVQHTYF